MKKIKVHVAVLTQGTVRYELAWKLMQWFPSPEYDVFFEFATARPIANNRNQIVKRFLESDAEFLLQIDDDVVPEQNPLDLIQYNKDVIIGPIPLIKEKVIYSSVYTENEDGSLKPFVANDTDLHEIAAGGTGIILVHRRVLEQIKAPFERIFDEDGIAIYGQDLSFCKKAREKGFKLFTHFGYKGKHYKTVDISSEIFDSYSR